MSQQSTVKPDPSHPEGVEGKVGADGTPGDPELQNEGEGSRSAARRYDADAERAAADPERIKELAKKAKDALTGPEAEELRAAEERGKNAKHH
jgi:hypothetical protein